jgi:hypothetical protein
MTINTQFTEIKTNVPSKVVLEVSGIGAGAADLTSVKGATLIDQTATGLYTVTLPRVYDGLINVVGMVMSSTAANWQVQLRSHTVGTDGKFLIAILSAADNAATAPTVTNLSTSEKLLLTVTVQDTAANPSSGV